MGGGVQRQQGTYFAIFGTNATGKQDVMCCQLVIVNGIKPKRGAIRVVGIKPGQLLDAKTPGRSSPRKTLCKQPGVLLEALRVVANSSEKHHEACGRAGCLKTQCLPRLKPTSATSGSAKSLPGR